jgi:hypothetical protein
VVVTMVDVGTIMIRGIINDVRVETVMLTIGERQYHVKNNKIVWCDGGLGLSPRLWVREMILFEFGSEN